MVVAKRAADFAGCGRRRIPHENQLPELRRDIRGAGIRAGGHAAAALRPLHQGMGARCVVGRGGGTGARAIASARIAGA
jgi:hypothetical protein